MMPLTALTNICIRLNIGSSRRLRAISILETEKYIQHPRNPRPDPLNRSIHRHDQETKILKAALKIFPKLKSGSLEALKD